MIFSISKWKYAYRRVEPREKRAYGRATASYLSASDASRGISCNWTKEASFEDMEEGIISITSVSSATWKYTGCNSRGKENRDKRTEHPDEPEQAETGNVPVKEHSYLYP